LAKKIGPAEGMKRRLVSGDTVCDRK
jgi:hypothetical protein